MPNTWSCTRELPGSDTMSIWKKATGVNVAEFAGELINGMGKAGDALFTSSEERIVQKAKLVEIFQAVDEKLLDQVQTEREEATKRWELDNSKGSFLTRNIRPMSLGVCILAMIFFTYQAGQGNVYPEEWVDLWKKVILSFVLAYTGGRSWEKISSFQRSSQARNESGMILSDTKVKKKDIKATLESVYTRLTNK